MANFDDMKFAVEALSGGKNTVVFDDVGMPSVMVILPKMRTDELITGGTQTTHPGWVLNGNELDKVAVSKYPNIIVNDRAYSLPFQDPRASITWDASLAACRKKGEFWGITPFSLWGAIALWCKKNSTMPRGNNNYGRDHAYTHEKGVVTYKYLDGSTMHDGRTATGSGPVTWNHNWQADGIADLNGNVWEWNAGMRLVMGEIQIIPYANCMNPTCDMGPASTEWKAIDVNGNLVAPGSANTLKLDFVGGVYVICTTITSLLDSPRGCPFQSVKAATGIVVPQILKELGYFPADVDGYESDYFYANNGIAERLPMRGGCWNDGAYAGVFYSDLHNPRSNSHHSVGFRSAYYGQL